MNTSGHVAFRLPPYKCDFSPTELVLAAVECFITDNNVGVEFSLNQLRDLTDVRVSSVTKHDWKHYCHHVKTTEDAYYKKECMISEVIDRIVIKSK